MKRSRNSGFKNSILCTLSFWYQFQPNVRHLFKQVIDELIFFHPNNRCAHLKFIDAGLCVTKNKLKKAGNFFCGTICEPFHFKRKLVQFNSVAMMTLLNTRKNTNPIFSSWKHASYFDDDSKANRYSWHSVGALRIAASMKWQHIKFYLNLKLKCITDGIFAVVAVDTARSYALRIRLSHAKIANESEWGVQMNVDNLLSECVCFVSQERWEWTLVPIVCKDPLQLSFVRLLVSFFCFLHRASNEEHTPNQ